MLSQFHPPASEPANAGGTVAINVYSVSFILFIPCVVDNQLTTLSPTKCTISFLDILYYRLTLKASTCFDPLWAHYQERFLFPDDFPIRDRSYSHPRGAARVGDAYSQLYRLSNINGNYSSMECTPKT
jgi:hypothetical protein